MNVIKPHPLWRVLSWNAFSVGIQGILGVLTVKVVAAYLGPTGIALTGQLRNFALALKSFSTLGLSNAMVKRFTDFKNQPDLLTELYRHLFWALGILGLLIISIVFLFSSQLSHWLFDSYEWKYVIQILALVLPLGWMHTALTAIWQANERFKTLVFAQMLNAVVLFVAFAWAIFSFGLTGAMWVLACTECFILSSFLLITRPKWSINLSSLLKLPSGALYKNLWKFSFMSLFSVLLIQGTQLLIRQQYMVQFNLETAGFWEASLRLSALYMNFFMAGISMYYLPKLSAISQNHELSEVLKSYLVRLFPLAFVVLLLLYLFRSSVISLVFSSEFLLIREYVIWQFIGDFFKLGSVAMGYQLVVKTELKKYMVVEIAFTVVYLSLSFLWMPHLGVEAALKAYALASVCSFAVLVLYFRKLLF